MELTHRFSVPVSIETAWLAFNDLEQITPCFPGAALTAFDGERFEGLCKVKLGPVSLQYTGSGRFVERDVAAKRALIEANGKDKRGNGTAAARVTAQLTANGDSTTAVEVTTNLNITGRPAQFGRGVMQDVSDRLLAQFSACLEDLLGSSASPPSDETGTATASEVSQSAAESPVAQQFTAAPAVETVDVGVTGSVADTGADADTGPSDVGAKSDSGPAPAAELDLGSAVIPVLLRRYAPWLVAAIAAVALLRKLGGRR